MSRSAPLDRPALWRILLTLTLTLLAPSRPVLAQPCPPPIEDVVFETTIEYFDFDPFGGTRTPVAVYGPTVGSIAGPMREVGSLNPRLQASSASASAAGRSLSIDLTNTVEALARRVDGHIFGNGAEIRIRVFVRGPQGTPYYLSRSADGANRAAFAGLGRADAWFNSTAASCVNATCDNTTPIAQFTTSMGVTGSEQLVIEGETYRLADQVVYTLTGGILQSIDFCFPFSPCPVNHLRANGAISGFVNAGIGTLPTCAGELDIQIQECQREAAGGFGSMRRPFTMLAEFRNSDTTQCECCRYEQFVRRIESFWEEEAQINPNCRLRFRHVDYRYNTDGDPLHGPCPVEDSVGNPDGCDSEYGSRGASACYPDVDGYFDAFGGTPNRASGCYYVGYDAPGFGGVPLNGSVRLLRYQAEFEGRIVLSNAPGCAWEGDPVIARRRWTVCCEGQIQGGQLIVSTCSGSAPPVPPLESTPCWQGSPSPPRIAPSGPINIVGRGGAITISRRGNIAVGTLSLRALPGESLSRGDITVTVPGATPFIYDNEPLMRFGDGHGDNFIVPFAALLPVAFPSTLPVSIAVLGSEPVVINVETSVLIPTCPADWSGDGQVNSADISEYLTDWLASLQGGTLVADFNGDNAVNSGDISAFLTAWLDAVQNGC